jgi:hypothetical protein
MHHVSGVLWNVTDCHRKQAIQDLQALIFTLSPTANHAEHAHGKYLQHVARRVQTLHLGFVRVAGL